MIEQWTPEEIQFLKDNHQCMTNKEMALKLNKSYHSTKRKVKKHCFDINEQCIPNGYVVIPQSPIHAVNNQGEVIRIKTRRKIKPSLNKKGYPQVCLQNGKSYRVHRLVAESFVANPDNKPQVNHIDGNKLNNHYLNLEWVTNTENRVHAIKTGLWDNISSKASKNQTGETNSAAKLTESQVLTIYQLLNDGHNVNEIAKKFNVRGSTISCIKHGKSWGHIYHYYSQGSTTRA